MERLQAWVRLRPNGGGIGALEVGYHATREAAQAACRETERVDPLPVWLVDIDGRWYDEALGHDVHEHVHLED